MLAAEPPIGKPSAPPSASLGVLLLWMLRRRRRFRVQGRSMLPSLVPGDHVFTSSTRAPITGDIVVSRHPFKTDVWLIKRVGAVGARVELLSDNPAEGSDSRTLGRVDRGLVQGVVVARA